VNRLAECGFPVERSSIVGTGLRSVEHVQGRMTAWRATLVGAAGGVMLGVLLALVAGILPWGPASVETLGFALVLGTVFGALSGALVHAAFSGGRREFISARRIEAGRYDLQVDEDSAGDAARLLSDRPR
jgi:hypothetical protein